MAFAALRPMAARCPGAASLGPERVRADVVLSCRGRVMATGPSIASRMWRSTSSLWRRGASNPPTRRNASRLTPMAETWPIRACPRRSGRARSNDRTESTGSSPRRYWRSVQTMAAPGRRAASSPRTSRWWGSQRSSESRKARTSPPALAAAMLRARRGPSVRLPEQTDLGAETSVDGFRRAIRRTVVDDDDLGRRAGLAEDAGDGSKDRLPPLIGRDEDGYPGTGHAAASVAAVVRDPQLPGPLRDLAAAVSKSAGGVRVEGEGRRSRPRSHEEPR